MRKLIDVHSYVAPQGYLAKLEEYARGSREPGNYPTGRHNHQAL